MSIYGAYHLIAIIILLNMLIALMSNTLARIQVGLQMYIVFCVFCHPSDNSMCPKKQKACGCLCCQQNSDFEWKFCRSRLWMTYFERRRFLPVPLNTMPNLWVLYQFGQWLRARCFEKEATKAIFTVSVRIQKFCGNVYGKRSTHCTPSSGHSTANHDDEWKVFCVLSLVSPRTA